MGAKSRGNWKVGWCEQSPTCANFRVRCDDCYKIRGEYTNYKGVNEDGRQDSEGSGSDMSDNVSRG